MFLDRFRGNPDMGDIDTKDNKITNIVFFAGFAVTLMVIIVLLMYAFL